jgi:TM2 domain-containing membrane protein YozV
MRQAHAESVHSTGLDTVARRGAHRFYLRQWGWGVLYLCFAWTLVPVFVAVVECFLISERAREYNEQVARDVLTKMDFIFEQTANAA